MNLFTRCVEETDKLALSGEKAYALLPQFLRNPAAAQFRAVKVVSRYSAVYRWGNVHGEVDKMSVLINGLSRSIKTIVARYRETQLRRLLTYNALVHFSKDE